MVGGGNPTRARLGVSARIPPPAGHQSRPPVRESHGEGATEGISKRSSMAVRQRHGLFTVWAAPACDRPRKVRHAAGASTLLRLAQRPRLKRAKSPRPSAAYLLRFFCFFGRDANRRTARVLAI